MFQLFDGATGKISDVLQFAFEWRPIRQSKDTIISLFFAFVRLKDFKYPNRFALQNQARIGSRVVNYENIKRIAIFRLGGWNEAPIVWIGQTCKERLDKSKGAKFRIKFQFHSTASWGFNDGIDMILVGPSWQLKQI